MSDFLWRVQITEYPEGALKSDPDVPEWMDPDPDWKPPNWAPTAEWIERYGKDTGDRFFWPSTDKLYHSRSTAAKRRQLIESFGAKAIVQRSSQIRWPRDGFATIAEDMAESGRSIASRANGGES